MDAQVEHMLALKVMRLTRPALINFGNTLFSEKSDLLQFDSENKNLPQNQMLQLPQGKGLISSTCLNLICFCSSFRQHLSWWDVLELHLRSQLHNTSSEFSFGQVRFAKQ